MPENMSYTLSDIRRFVKTHPDLEESNKRSDLLFNEQLGQVDLLFRFTHDRQQAPALGFRRITPSEYTLIYLASNLKEEWEANSTAPQPRPASFIDIANLDDVNASVDAMRASLFGATDTASETSAKPLASALLYRVAHAGHEVTAHEATQLYDLAKALEGFLGTVSTIGRSRKK